MSELHLALIRLCLIYNKHKIPLDNLRECITDVRQSALWEIKVKHVIA